MYFSPPTSPNYTPAIIVPRKSFVNNISLQSLIESSTGKAFGSHEYKNTNWEAALAYVSPGLSQEIQNKRDETMKCLILIHNFYLHNPDLLQFTHNAEIWICRFLENYTIWHFFDMFCCTASKVGFMMLS